MKKGSKKSSDFMNFVLTAVGAVCVELARQYMNRKEIRSIANDLRAELGLDDHYKEGVENED